jgi:hypothetical protein
MLTRLGLGVILGCWTLCATLATSAALASWSAPALLGGCARASSQAPPLVVFPSSQPQARSGPGALLWTGPSACGKRVAGATRAGASTEALAAPLDASGLPGHGRALSAAPGAPAEIAAVTGTALGQIVALGDGVLAEGSSPGALAAPLALGGPAQPVAVTSGYLGDTAVLSTVRERPARWALALRIQRHYSSTPAAPRLLAAGAARPSALAVAMDYRSDVLVAWVAGAAIYARQIPARGAPGRIERVGAGTGIAELRALISDDGRAIVAWRAQAPAPGGRARTSIESNISGPGMVFARATSVESFTDPPGLVPPPGSLQLTRLSSEAVMIAWTAISAGRYAVRASPVSLRRGVWAPVTISPRGTQALLAELIAGPRAEVLALWTTAPRLRDGALDPRRRAIFAAWGHYGGHGEARFAAPEAVATAGPNGTPAAAFDPQSDTALAAWAVGTVAPRIAYAQRAAGAPPGASRAAPAVRARGHRSAREAVLPALGLLLLAGAAAWQQRRGRHPGTRLRRAARAAPCGPARR